MKATAVDGDEPPAITDPTTRRTLRRGAWFAIGTITIGVAAFIAAGVAISGSNARYERLERDGARTVGTVVDFDRSGRGPASVAYEFTWDGDVHRERVSAIEADDYEVGDRVVILVDPADPGTSAIRGEPSVSQWMGTLWLLGSIGGLTAFVSGAIFTGRWAWRSCVLRKAPWKRMQLAFEARSTRSGVWVRDLDATVTMRIGPLGRDRLTAGADGEWDAEPVVAHRAGWP